MPSTNLDLPAGISIDEEVRRLLNERFRQIEDLLASPRVPLVVSVTGFPAAFPEFHPPTVILPFGITFRTAQATLKVPPSGGTLGVAVRAGGKVIVGLTLGDGAYTSQQVGGEWFVPAGVPLQFEVSHGGTPTNAAGLAVMLGY